MARLNMSIGHRKDADEEVISGSPHNKAENSNEEDEADGADMSALINLASGKKTPPPKPISSSRPPGILQKFMDSTMPYNLGAQDNPLEEHILTPENTKASGTDDVSRSEPASAPISGGRSLVRPSKIHYDMNAKPRPDIYEIPEDEPAPNTRRSSRRQGRGSEGVRSSRRSIRDEELRGEKESTNEQNEEASLAVSEITKLPKKTVNDIQGKMDDNQESDGDARSRDEAAEPQDKAVPGTRSRGRPRNSLVSAPAKLQEEPAQAKRSRNRPGKAKGGVSTRVLRESKRKAQEDADEEEEEEEEEGQIEAPVRNLAKPAKSTRSSKRQKVDATPQKPQEILRKESPELDAPHDEGVDPILRSPTPETQDQPTISRRREGSDSHLVSEEREPQSLDTDDEEDYETGVEGEVEDEAGDGAENEIEEENLQGPEKGPITNADIKLMRDLMRNVGAGMIDGELSRQDKPKLVTQLGKLMSKWTSKAIERHQDIQKAKGGEDDRDALQNAQDSIDKYLRKIEELVAKVVDSNLMKDRMHDLRFRMITDIYAYSIPDLVELVSVFVKSYKNDENELEEPGLIRIQTTLDYLLKLCTIARDQPKALQPKIPGCQLSGPTRSLIPVVKDLLKKCTKEIEERERRQKAADWRAGAPERERERQRKRAAEEAERQALAATSGSHINPHSSIRRFTQPSSRVIPEEELSDIQRAAKAEKLAYDTADAAKKADLNARRLAKEASANPFDNDLVADAEAAEQSARSTLHEAVEAEEKKVELALLINLKPGPSHIDSLLHRSGSGRPKLDSTVKPKQTLGRHNLHVPVTSEWNDQELLIMVNGLRSIPGNEKYTMIEEHLPHRSRQEILDKAKEFQRDQIEAWQEIRRRNPSCKPLPQWIYGISRGS